jgi:pSer/pThr/pTyr-binding forkhead associated (FHA) protein
MRVQLIPVEGGKPIELAKQIMIVGRGEFADIPFENKSVSKQHCILVRTDGLVLIRDLGSTNGTRVNGQRVRRGALLPNDQVAFANFKYILKYSDTVAEADANAVQQLDFELADADAPSKEKPAAAGAPPAVRNTLPDAYPA